MERSGTADRCSGLLVSHHRPGLLSLCLHLPEPDRGWFLEEKDNRDDLDHGLHDDKQSGGLICSQKVQRWFNGVQISEDAGPQ